MSIQIQQKNYGQSDFHLIPGQQGHGFQTKLHPLNARIREKSRQIFLNLFHSFISFHGTEQ